MLRTRMPMAKANGDGSKILAAVARGRLTPEHELKNGRGKKGKRLSLAAAGHLGP